MHKHSQNGHRRRSNSASKDDLLTQREYAEEIGVTPGYVSKRTNSGGMVDETYRPRLDARWEGGDPDTGKLLGYTEPTPRPASDGDPSSEAARKAPGGGSTRPASGSAGPPSDEPVSGNGSVSGDRSSANRNGRGVGEEARQPKRPARENPPAGSLSGQSPQTGGEDVGSGLEQVASGFGKALEKDRVYQEAFIRLLGAAGGALLAAGFAEEVSDLGAATVGATLGYGIVEISLQVGPSRPVAPARTPSLDGPDQVLVPTRMLSANP